MMVNLALLGAGGVGHYETETEAPVPRHWQLEVRQPRTETRGLCFSSLGFVRFRLERGPDLPGWARERSIRVTLTGRPAGRPGGAGGPGGGAEPEAPAGPGRSPLQSPLM
jgi:hypothetical protein